MSGIQNYLHDNHLLSPRSTRSSAASGNGITVTGEVNLEVAQEQLRKLAALSVSRPVIRKYIQDAVRKELQKVRKNISQDMKSNLGSDPRHAYKAVKYSLYKSLLGGNVSILNPRRAGAKYQLVRNRKLDENPKQWGGNRRERSGRTEQVDTYYGKDRAFILRFVNSGTKPRMTKYGNRGQIASRRLFELSALFQMPQAADGLAELIEGILKEEFDKE